MDKQKGNHDVSILHPLQTSKTLVFCHDNGVIQRKTWTRHGKVHSVEHYPAVLNFDENGCLTEATWQYKGVMHREPDYPSSIRYCTSFLMEAKWYNNDKVTRAGDKPARISYYHNGEVLSEEWLENDKIHRVTGPANILHSSVREEIIKEYYVNGIALTLEEWQQNSLVQEHYRKLENNTSGNIITNISL